MGKKVKRTVLLSLIIIIFLFSFALVFSQERKLEIKYPEIFGIKPETIETSLPEYAKYIFNFSIIIVGLILFGVLIWAGFLYLTSAGQPAKLQEAKERITSVFLGVVLLLSSYIVLTTINPELAIFKLPLLEKITPPAYKPPEYKPEERTQIFWEIPIGQMLENGLWEEKRTNNLKALLITLENFLKAKITLGSENFERISDLNKKLKVLTESCHCEALTGICQKPKNFAQPVGCSGDPCQQVRTDINNALTINKKKTEELLAFKKKLIETKNLFEEEGRKFRNLTDILEGCKQTGLLTRAEYYDSVALIEEQGGTTKLERLYQPAKDDPLVFYCATGGTVFDEPYSHEPIPYEEIEKTKEFSLVPAERELLSCPAVIPLGELVSDQISAVSYETNSGLEELIYYIDKISVELTKMAELVSQCNESRCQIDCSCIPNPCFTKCAPHLNPCLLFCKSPCLQTIGGCHGEPCPRQKIIETTERIKIYENEIFSLLDQIKGNIEDAQDLLNTQEEDKIDLRTIRAATQTCLGLGARTTVTKKPGGAEEEPFWVLLRCEMAIGNKGPDGNIITDCHPQNLYCCTNKPPTISHFPAAVQKERPPVFTPLPEESYSPSGRGFNNVPYFSQLDEKWKNKSFGCGKTIGASGCGPTSIAMALNAFGIKTDPPTMADWILKNGYRVCGSGTSWSACPAAVKHLGKEKGIKSKVYNQNIKGVLEELRNGKNKVAVVSSRGAPPYTKGGHYIVLTGIEKEWGEEFVYYNDPAYNPRRPKRRPPQGRKPVDWFERLGIRAGCVVYY